MTDLERIESKIDRLLFLLGEGRPKSQAEIRRDVDQIIIRLQSRKKPVRKEHERADPGTR